MTAEVSVLPVWSNQEIRDFQKADANLSIIIRWLESDGIPQQCPPKSAWQLQSLWTQSGNLKMLDGVLYRQYEDIQGGGNHKRFQLVLPAAQVPDILAGLHNTAGHLGAKKTLEKIRCRFYWPGQKKEVERWCSDCIECNSRKSPVKNRAPLQLSLAAQRPMERIAMDILGPLPVTPRGNRYILVIGDYFTKWKEAFPLADMEASSIAKVVVHEFICRFGVPDTIHTDQGKNFESGLIKDICRLLGVKKTRTTPYHPESDGLVERFNRTLIDMLSTAVTDNEKDWDLLLPTLLFAYRTSMHETTGTTPFFLMFGRYPRLPEDIIYSLPVTNYTSAHQYCHEIKKHMQEAYRRVGEYVHKERLHQKANYDRHVKGNSYVVNDLVFLHCPAVPRGQSRKLHKPWQGPYRVVEVIGPTVYRIVECKNPGRKKVVHFNRLKRAPPEPLLGMDNVPERPMENRPPVHPLPDVADLAPMQQPATPVVQQPVVQQPVVQQPVVQQPVDQQPIIPAADVPGPLEIIPPVPGPAELPRRSGRQTRPPIRYGDPISLPDDVIL